MRDDLIALIEQSNPWLADPSLPYTRIVSPILRFQEPKLLLVEWDLISLILVGPRQAGKTTLGLDIAEQLIKKERRFQSLLYLNCDLLLIREWLQSPLFIQQALEQFKLKNPIFFIDEIQRLENPGLFLKSCVDLKLPIKWMVSGSSQLEIKSKVQEFLTGRQLEALILPLSFQEIGKINNAELIYGCYPAVVTTSEKKIILNQLYQQYIAKDIIEFLKIGKPDVMQKLITLIAHSSGQLINFTQLAVSCQVSVPTIQNYLTILEKTYTIHTVRPFVGNKRKEIISNPVIYFIDNGFRNQALRNFNDLESRTDAGLLIQSSVFQEILKYKTQGFLDFDVFYWRTQSGAEVDFVLFKNQDEFIPIEVKFRNMSSATVTRGFRSFIEAYQPKYGFFITKDFNQTISIGTCKIYFISFYRLFDLFVRLDEFSW